jgi:dehydrogenase/reductase SDR family protein 4
VNEKFGGLDILVSNAGISPAFGNMLETKEDIWDKTFEVNLKASFFLCKEAMPLIEKKGGGSVIFVSSIGGYQPSSYIGPYSVSKTALLGLVKALVQGCAEKNVRVNAIAPGIIKTKFSQVLWEQEKAVAATIPLGRLGVSEDCAGAVAFLVSDDASFITGETIVMAGGSSSRL